MNSQTTTAAAEAENIISLLDYSRLPANFWHGNWSSKLTAKKWRENDYAGKKL